MKEQVLQYIKKYHMLEAGDKVIVGVSGGADSVCLLFMLRELQEVLRIELYGVYVEHGIRGEASIADGEFAARLCERWQIPFQVAACDVMAEAAIKKISVEEAGREARYRIFEKVRKEEGGDKIAVAHNLNDTSETLMMNLVRGTGLKGMSGIPPVRDKIIRPLLTVARAQIETCLKEHHIEFRTDHTNLEDIYTRNKMRIHVLPYLEQEVNERAVHHIAKSADIFREAEEYIYAEAKKVQSLLVTERNSRRMVPCGPLSEYPEIIQKYVLMAELENKAGKRKDFTTGHLEELLGMIKAGDNGYVNLPYGLAVRKRYGYLELFKEEQKKENISKTYELHVPGEYQIDEAGGRLILSLKENNNRENIPENKYTKWFDYDIIKGNLQLRKRMPGDYFAVNGDGGRKKLKSYFIDEKIPSEQRADIFLLAEQSHILWIVGYRISEKYKVTEKTRRILEVRIDGGELHGR